jgi:hypothetical protein
MVEIKVNERVLAELRKAFPKPPNSAQKALDKYLNALRTLVIQSLSRGATPMETKLNAFSVSLQTLANKGGQIGKDKKRLHAWLRDNELALVEPVEIGSNLTGTVSKVKFTELVTLQWHEPESMSDMTTVDGVGIKCALLEAADQNSQQLFDRIYPDYGVCIGDHRFDEVFDVVDVDTQSLRNYVLWLQEEAEHFTETKRNHYLFQARLILAIANHTGGRYYQRKIKSDFGRTYYAGTSVQNVNKRLRQAMLGDCWEYDIRSSVVAWKMGFARDYVKEISPETTVEKTFAFTLAYLSDKVGFMKNVKKDVFGTASDLAEELQIKMLKQAFTAISFGARQSSHGWLNKNGEWETASISAIFKREDERNRFISNFYVSQFAIEQAILDEYLFAGVIADYPDLLRFKYLQTSAGRPSKPKVIAFLYQHEETRVMDVVRAALAEFGHTVLANIHDAIVLKRRMSTYTKHEVELRMQEQTQNPYWRLGLNRMQRWAPSLRKEMLEEQMHR